MSERQKTALVTGASSGIGHAVAIEFAKRGYRVFACARRLEPMEDLKSNYKDIETFRLDVLSLESVKSAKEYLTKETGGYLDILFNNAGQSCTFPALDVTDEWFKQCYEVNVFGPIRLVRELGPLVINAKGTIGFTGSVSGVVPFPFSSIYSSTKAAIHQYAATLRLELQPFGVRVLNIVTGGVRTEIEDTRSLPLTSLYQVDGIEEVMVKRRQMARRNNPMAPETYAVKVVNDFENKYAGLNVYRGNMASLLGHVLLWCPRWLLERILIRQFKLVDIFKLISTKYSKSHID